MPSTPRMIELERKASTPGEGLSRDEVSEWHAALVFDGLQQAATERLRAKLQVQSVQISDDEMMRCGVYPFGLRSASDYTAANRYLDSPAWKAR